MVKLEIGETPTLCLNMIVKNESKIIRRLLDSVMPIIDTYCICDTGSTDNTVEIIESYFEEKGVAGKIVREPFKNFEYNRTFALQSAVGMSDYVLLLDADMILRIGADFDKSADLGGAVDAYHLFQGSDSYYYKNTRIVKNDSRVKYWGVTHEVVSTPDGWVYGTIPRNKLFIQDIGDGGAKSDKFERDIRLLLDGIKESPDNQRYYFYLGNSYHDCGKYVEAIPIYQRRIELGGWKEEVWYSHYKIGSCYKNMGNMANAIHWWMKGFNYHPQRLENLYCIIEHYRSTGHNAAAYLYCVHALNVLETLDDETIDNFLFLQKDVYSYKLYYEMSICGYYYNLNKIDLAELTCEKLFMNTLIPRNIFDTVLGNYKFYAPKLSTHFTSVQNYDDASVAGFVSSTPTFCRRNDDDLDCRCAKLICVRYVDYRIDEKGAYINGAHITTKNKMITPSKTFWLKYDTAFDDRYVGIEDIRLFSASDGRILYSSNRGLPDGKIVVEIGEIDIENETTKNARHLTTTNRVEKNWCFAKDDLLIYKWSPLTIKNLEGETVEEYECPWNSQIMNHIRGSTNGVRIGDELWFVCHLVSYEDRRYYYHVFIILDWHTMKFKKISRAFAISGEKVEYILGFDYNASDETVDIGYSILDRSSHIATMKLRDIVDHYFTAV